MPLLDLSLFKKQLRLEADDDSEDELLTLYLSSAEANISRLLGQKVYRTTAEIDPLIPYALSLEAEPDVTLAILLLASHFYLHREAVSDIEMSEIPMGVKAIVGPLSILYPEL